jgi:Mrp family chromosome partitioning ATPase
VDALGAVRELATMLDQLRHRFDMIVIVPPPSAGDALAVSMARYVDGSIVVVAAERTRAAAATRLKEVLIRSGSPLIGAVFYRPRNILPRFLRRLR